MKTGTTIAIAAVVGVVGYFAYKKFKENQDAKKLLEGGGSDVGSGAGAGTSTGSSALTNPNIRALQTWLQITPDGKAGKITNGKIEYYWSAYDNTYDADKMFAEGYPNLLKAKGLVTEANAKYYLDILKASKSPRQMYEISKGKGAAAAASAADRTNRANAIKSAYSGNLKLRTTKSSTFMVVNFDSSTKTYPSTGKSLSFNGNATFLSPESASAASVNRVKISATTTSGNLVISVDPIASSPYLLLVNPFDLIVTA
jgi:hypothetical protein